MRLQAARTALLAATMLVAVQLNESGVRAQADDEDPAAMECREKLEIIAGLVDEEDSFEMVGQIVAQANKDGYPENTLGYVWCGELNNGLTAAVSDIDGVSLTVAPYLPDSELPITVGAVDEKAGNDLESAAVMAVLDAKDADALSTYEALQDTSLSVTTASYPWSGQASISAQVPTLGEGEEAPTKTGMSRVYQMEESAGPDKPMLFCSCGISTSDTAAEGGYQAGGDGADGEADAAGDADDATTAATAADDDSEGGEEGGDSGSATADVATGTGEVATATTTTTAPIATSTTPSTTTTPTTPAAAAAATTATATGPQMPELPQLPQMPGTTSNNGAGDDSTTSSSTGDTTDTSGGFGSGNMLNELMSKLTGGSTTTKTDGAGDGGSRRLLRVGSSGGSK